MTSIHYEKENAAEFAQAALKAGFRAFLAKSGTYGFYTDATGSKVISFQFNYLSPCVSGNYRTNQPKHTGTGWRISDDAETSPSALRAYFDTVPPRWAVGNARWRYTTLEDHLKTYGGSSGYEEIFP